MVGEADGDHRIVARTDDGDVDVDERIRAWAASDEGRPFLAARGADAGLTKPRGGAETNPWASKHWSLIEQMRIFRADREKADRLANAAGDATCLLIQ